MRSLWHIRTSFSEALWNKWLLYFRHYTYHVLLYYHQFTKKNYSIVLVLCWHTMKQLFYLCIFVQWPFSSCGGPSELNECWKWSKHSKHVCKHTCLGKSLYNGTFVYANVHMCYVVNLCQLCVAVPPDLWPPCLSQRLLLTGRQGGWRSKGAGTS